MSSEAASSKSGLGSHQEQLKTCLETGTAMGPLGQIQDTDMGRGPEETEQDHKN